ncbi:hypothetical protein AM228_11995 [Planktothricoides sp. SR001]|nr:hypothetical protein AM228_11995 [Planktothricoides sp. SR001]
MLFIVFLDDLVKNADYRFLSVLNDFSRFLKYLQYLVTFAPGECGGNMGKTGNITYWAIAEGVRRFAHYLVSRPENGMSVNLNIPITSIPAPIPPTFLKTAIAFLSRFW